MGLWDKVKGAVQAMTGGGATVNVTVGEASIGRPFIVNVEATANADIELSAVYVIVRANEFADVRDVGYQHADEWHRIDHIEASHQTFKQRFDIASGCTLSDGETKTWSGEIRIPESANPSFDGEMISHRWAVMAALDAYGNDPDSGWQEFEIWDA